MSTLQLNQCWKGGNPRNFTMDVKPLESHPNRYILPSTRRISLRNPETLTDTITERHEVSMSTGRKRRHSDSTAVQSHIQGIISDCGGRILYQTLPEDTVKKPKTAQNDEGVHAHPLCRRGMETAITAQITCKPQGDDITIANELPVNNDSILVYGEGEGSVIVLHKVLAKNLRSHQIEGLRFLWRQVAVAPSPPVADHNGQGEDEDMYGEVNNSGGGALLAHTMGLGKTVTIIAFLFTLAEAQGPTPVLTANPSLSYNFRVGQHMARVLILVPGGLLTNWALELKTWAAKFSESSCGRKLLTTVYRIGNNLNLEQRITVLTKWHASGGILLLGHELFRSLVDAKETTFRSQSQQSEVERCLLEPGAQLVVADEAHAFKNTQSKITRAVNRISTRNRIALTGSPLSNSLLEFYSLMSWVSPESELGETVAEFRETYYTPIMNVLGGGGKDDVVDSLDSGDDTDERENAEIARNALEGIIRAAGGKIHRKKVDTIQQYLKSKTEYIVRVPLTDKQVLLYNNYLRESADNKSSAMWRLFCLRALCNHPDVFKRILRRGIGKKRAEEGWIPKKKREKKRNSTPSSDPVVLPLRAKEGFDHEQGGEERTTPGKPGETRDNSTSNSVELALSEDSPHPQLPATTNENKRAILTPDKAKVLIKASSKFVVLFRLLEEFKAIGDKALLFSHNLETLNYLYTLAITLGFTVLRLDGSVHFQQRHEDLIQFNHGVCDIYLVSTKAGGVGLNLQCANRVIILDNDHSPVWEQQAIGRSYRMGQEKEVFVYRFLVEGSVETKIAREKRRKVRLSDVVVDGIWEKRKTYGMITDHRAVWESARKVRVPKTIGNAGAWRGRDQILDKVVASVRVITDIRVDIYETTSTSPTAPTTIREEDYDVGAFLSDVDLDLRSAENENDVDDNAQGQWLEDAQDSGEDYDSASDFE